MSERELADFVLRPLTNVGLLDSFRRIKDDLTCRLVVCGLRWEDCVPDRGGKESGGGSGCRGVENGVEEELPVVGRTNSLINFLYGTTLQRNVTGGLLAGELNQLENIYTIEAHGKRCKM